MTDQSYLDLMYFIDSKVYNCPFCNRNNVAFRVKDAFEFNWSPTKICFAFLAECSSCKNISMHLSFEKIIELHSGMGYSAFSF